MPVPASFTFQASTDGIAPGERFDYWREERGSRLFSVGMELARPLRPRFQARLAARAIGEATFVDMSGEEAYDIERSAGHCARTPAGALCLTQLVDGHGWRRTRNGDHTLSVGDVSLGHTDVPYGNGPVRPGRFHLRVLKLPARGSRRASTPPQFRRLTSGQGADALLRDYFQSFVRHFALLDDAAASAAVRVLGDLALMAVDVLRADDPSRGAAVDAVLLQRVRDLVETELQRPELEPAWIARRCGVSLRRLHQLFEPTGTTFWRYVTQRRVERARHRLASPGRASVAEIAFECGFVSLPTFYRAFRRAFGAAPGDLRGRVPTTRNAR